jgi:hypothetical protein
MAAIGTVGESSSTFVFFKSTDGRIWEESDMMEEPVESSEESIADF